MRLRLGVAGGIAVIACAITGTARAGTALIVTGHGWGHGVGMCQCGAGRMALEGKTAPQIFEHYFPGAKVEKMY